MEQSPQDSSTATLGVSDIGETTVPVVSEAALAGYLQRTGRRVVFHRGRPWEQLRPGFFRPVNALARFSAAEATRPTLGCWGFQACVRADERRANASVPVHLISDLDGFREEVLPGSRRYKLRKARRLSQLVRLSTPELLQQQGYGVLRSSHSRTGYGRLPTEVEFQAGLDHFGDPASGIVLVGLVEGKLGGYVTGYAVDGTAYLRDLVVSTDALDTEMSTGLTYEFIFACRRSPQISEMLHGLHVREDEGLSRYKEWLGIPVSRVPARVEMLPGAAALTRRLSPHKYYRLTGRT